MAATAWRGVMEPKIRFPSLKPSGSPAFKAPIAGFESKAQTIDVRYGVNTP